MSNSVFPAAVRGLAYTVVKTMEDSVLVQESPSLTSTRILQAQNPRWHWRLEYTVLFDNILRPNPAYQYTDLQTMLGFCQSMYSNYDDFLFSDPDDNSVGPGIITAGWQANFPYMLGTTIVVGGNAWQVSSAPAGARSGLIQPPFVSSPQTDNGLTWAELGAVTGTGWPNLQAQLQVVTDDVNFFSPLQRNLGGQFYEDITDLAGALTIYDNGTLTTNYTVQSGGLAIPGFSCSGIYLAWTAAPTGPVTATFNFYYRAIFEDSTQDFEKFVNQMWALGGEEGAQGKGYLKFQSVPLIDDSTPGFPAVWTGTGSPITAPPTVLPPPTPSGTTGTVDLKDWMLISSPTRTTSHLKGDLYSASIIDTDAAYPAGFPSGVFFWIKNTSGHPWDIERYDASFISHWITEDGDAADQAACQAAGFTSCWIDQFAYKRFLTPVHMMPRSFVLGSTVTIDTPGPNTFRRTTNCENSFTLINLGDVRAITTGPFSMNWGGSIGTQDTIQNDYYYGGRISTGVFQDKESTFYVLGYGRVAWKYYKRSTSGTYVLQQSSINNTLVSGGSPVPVFPCGSGQPWWV